MYNAPETITNDNWPQLVHHLLVDLLGDVRDVASSSICHEQAQSKTESFVCKLWILPKDSFFSFFLVAIVRCVREIN